jgi:hypothetical protein
MAWNGETHMRDVLYAIESKSQSPLAISWLRLAATPTFATMALMTALGGSESDLLCATLHHASPLGGMAPMYLLMSAFHSAPWLKLICSR